MSILEKNIQYLAPRKLSAWRKIAMGTWRTAGDPSVYGVYEANLEHVLPYLEKLKTHSGKRVTLTHFFGRVSAQILKETPQINCILRWGRLYQRKNVDIFFQVASDGAGEDLSGTTIRNADQKSVLQIAEEIEARVQKIRARQDQSFTKMKNSIDLLPGFLVPFLISFSRFFTIFLNFWSPLLGTPKDAFGSLMLTNIGSLGLDMAFAPLVPYSGVPILIAMGSLQQKPIARDGQVVVVPVLKLCVTFDHRLIDGIHAAKMTRTLERVLADPAKELGTV